MNVPELDRRQLAHSPLTSVVLQLRFDPNSKVSEAKTASVFHQALGGAKGLYPKLTSISEMSVNVALGPVGMPQLAPQTGLTPGWRLTDEEGEHSVTLMPDSLAVESNAYDGWDNDFAPRFQTALEALAEHVDPVFEQRLGLRYVNQVREPEITRPADWANWIDATVLGIVMHDDLGPLVKLARQQAIMEIGDGVRCTLNHGFAPDPERGAHLLSYLIDIDVSREGMRPFDRAAISECATEFNNYALRVFQGTVSPDLRDRLREP